MTNWIAFVWAINDRKHAICTLNQADVLRSLNLSLIQLKCEQFNDSISFSHHTPFDPIEQSINFSLSLTHSLAVIQSTGFGLCYCSMYLCCVVYVAIATMDGCTV